MKEIGARTTVMPSGGGLQIRIRAPRNWGMLLFLPVWFAGWTFGGVMAMKSFAQDPEPFLAVWLLGWLAGEAFVILAWSWGAFGVEAVAVDQGVITVAKRIGKLKLERAYAVHEVSNIRAAGWFGNPMSFEDSMRPWGFTGGTVALDYKGRPIRFGIALPEGDARLVASELAPYARGAA